MDDAARPQPQMWLEWLLNRHRAVSAPSTRCPLARVAELTTA